MQVGPGVKGIREGEWVVPLKSHMGTWQSLAIMKGADLIVIPKECMPAEYAALSEQLCLAFCLLEQFGKLKVPCTRPAAVTAKARNGCSATQNRLAMDSNSKHVNQRFYLWRCSMAYGSIEE